MYKRIAYFGYLVRTSDPESVEDGYVDSGGGEDDEEIPQPYPPVDGRVVVHLGRSPQERDRRHEAGEEGQPHGHGAHVPSRQQELLGVGLLAVLDGVK